MARKPLIGKLLAVGIILIFIGTCIIPAIAQDTEKPLQTSRGNWLYVGGSGPGNYTRIRDAIDNASDGDTVFVYDDSSPYNEWMTIDHSITLLGEARNTTIIKGSLSGMYVIHIIAQNVIVSGFTLLNNQGDGINVESDNVTITNTIITGMRSAAVFIKDANHINISYNVLTDSVTGIFILYNPPILFTCGYNIIAHNIIRYTNEFGIHVSGNYNVIHGNDIAPADSSIDGVELSILLQGSFNNISYNTISSLQDGIEITSSYKNILYRNNFIGNKRFGVLLSDASGDKILENNFMDNTKNARIINMIVTSLYLHIEMGFPLLPTHWMRNFWDKPRSIPYPIAGHLMFGFLIPFYLELFFQSVFRKSFIGGMVNFVRFDWHPAQEPYDIPGISE